MAYRARAQADWVREHGRWAVEAAGGRPGQSTFEVREWRWIAERTFGWLGRYRRPSKDDEHHPVNGEARIDIAMIHRMSRFRMPRRNRDDNLLGRPPKRRKC